MITQYGGYPAFDVMFDAGGHVVDAAAEAEAIAYFTTGDGRMITDVMLFAHGWNNDEAEARAGLYSPFFAAFRSIVPHAPHLAGRTFGAVALFWPSKKFADADLIPGGAAAAAASGDARLAAQLDRLSEVFASDPTASAKIARARTLVPKLEFDPASQDDFVATLLSLVPPPRYDADEGLDDAIGAMKTTAGRDVLARLGRPFVPVVPFVPGSGGAASFSASGTGSTPFAPGTGSAAGWIGDVTGGIKSAASNLGNLLTYYTMKDRAGIVGRTGAVGLLTALMAGAPAGGARRYHAIGHSFGGRLVTSALAALRDPGAHVDTLLLLEAAYSHNGLATNWDGAGANGSFRSVVAPAPKASRVLITHSVHDMPVGVAYPIASRAMNQAADALFGGPHDKFGGMGRNGAQHTPEAVDDVLRSVGAANAYAPFPPGKIVRNLSGDGPLPAPTIGGHGDVAKPEIAWAFAMHL